jgi:vacuolar-type H+-ATPase subunit H
LEERVKEVVRKIIDTEREVRERIEEARGEAQKTVRDAEVSSRELLEEAKQKAVREGQELIARLQHEAEVERDRQVEMVKGGSPELMTKRKKEIDRAVKRIVALIAGKESA